VPVYADASEMIRIHKPQILVIATHPDSHYHYCRLAAQNKVPLVICEKPLADTIQDARKIAGLEKNGLIIITNHERRYSADYIRAKEILAASVSGTDSRLGKLLCVNAKIYMGKTRRLLDVFWHDATHLADAIMFLTNMVLKHKRRYGAKLTQRNGTAWLESVLIFRKIPHAKTQRRKGDNKSRIGENKKLKEEKFVDNLNEMVINSALKQQTPNPKPLTLIPVQIELGAGRDHLVFEMEFSCEKGRLRIGNGVFEIWESSPSTYAENFRSLKKSDETFKGLTGYFSNMVKDAVLCLREPGRQPCSSAIDGLRVIEYLNSVKSWKFS